MTTDIKKEQPIAPLEQPDGPVVLGNSRMRVVHEFFLVSLPAVAVGALVLSWPRAGEYLLNRSSPTASPNGEPLIVWIGCIAIAIATMVLAFRGLRRPQMRAPVRGMALLLAVLSASLSVSSTSAGRIEFGLPALAALAAAGTFWALLEMSIEDQRHSAPGEWLRCRPWP
jgi:hypothetical protein